MRVPLCVLFVYPFEVANANTEQYDPDFFCCPRAMRLVVCLHTMFVVFSRILECRFRFACDRMLAACSLLCVPEHDTGSGGRVTV